MTDVDWVPILLDDVLSHWLSSAPTENGLFHPDLDRQWQRLPGDTRTLVSQCRLIYNFARGYERTDDEAYALAARSGITALVLYFLDPNVSGAEGYAWNWSCDREGRVTDDHWNAYGHAFVILALATAASVFEEDAYRELALDTWRFVRGHLRDDHGGLIWHVGSDGRARDENRSQNPVMHTFEALLALAPLDDTGAVRRDAADVWRFIKGLRTPAPLALPEWYDAQWQPLAEGSRSGVDIGHAFEWAYLLSEAQRVGVEAELEHKDLLIAGRQFLTFGVTHGYDYDAGGIFSTTVLDGQLKDRSKGWWQQCEAIRALHRYAVRHGDEQLLTALRQTLDFAHRHFVDDEYGGWYTRPPGLGGETCLDKGNPYKLDYHVVNMCLELLSPLQDA
jgi:mannose-6-phosphate isomerase